MRTESRSFFLIDIVCIQTHQPQKVHEQRQQELQVCYQKYLWLLIYIVKSCFFIENITLVLLKEYFHHNNCQSMNKFSSCVAIATYLTYIIYYVSNRCNRISFILYLLCAAIL